MKRNPEGLAEVGRFLSVAEAETVRAMLEGNGLRARLRDEFTGAVNWFYVPALGGIAVEVERDRLDEALELLGAEAETELPADPTEERRFMRQAKASKRRQGLLAILCLVSPSLALLAWWLGGSGSKEEASDTDE